MEANGIVLSPDPRLRQECAVIEEITPAIEALAEKMKKMMFDNGGCGLAAPQIGELIQLVTIDCDYSDKNDYDPYVLINPVIVDHSKQSYETEEGCLSLTGQRSTQRYPMIVVEYLDRHFKKKKQIFRDFEAQIIQHEIDHFSGILI